MLCEYMGRDGGEDKNRHTHTQGDRERKFHIKLREEKKIKPKRKPHRSKSIFKKTPPLLA